MSARVSTFQFPHTLTVRASGSIFCTTAALLGTSIDTAHVPPMLCAKRCVSSRFRTCGATVGSLDSRKSEETDEPSETSALSAAMSSPHRYRRRSSDPQTPRERADFRRDHQYAQHRPLPDVPWRELKAKTYLDDAERLHGRKETWYTVKDSVLREKLVSILHDYLRDTLAAARLEEKDARKYAFLCSVAAKHYRAQVSAGAFGLPQEMQRWARELQKGRASSSQALSDSAGSVADGDAKNGSTGLACATETSSQTSAKGVLESDSISQNDPTAVRFREQRRRRGEEATLSHTPATSDLPEADTRHSPRSAFPFLRQRALEDESSLDPSLVDWTAKYFPDDSPTTFTEPPRLRAGMVSTETGEEESGQSIASASNGDSHDVSGLHGSRTDRRRLGFATGLLPMAGAGGSVHARHRLHRTLRDHENRRHATFDGEGIYYKVLRPSETEESTSKPQQVKASDLTTPERNLEVVKVPWNIAAQAKMQGYTSATLRAKERLIRLTRGEDPKTIP